MLAMLPASVPHHNSQHHVPAKSSPAVTLSQHPRPGPAGQSQVRPSKPRLTVNTKLETSKPRTFGKGSSLSLNTLSAVSPTIKNTFVNAYHNNSQNTHTLRPKLLIDPAVGQDQDFGTFSDQGSSRTPSTCSVSSSSTTSFEHHSKLLYSQPEGIASILVTSLAHKSFSISMSDKPRPGLASKRVSFREPLEEEIKTMRYIMAHSDIESTDAIDSGSSATTPNEIPSPKPLIGNELEQSTFDLQVPSTLTDDTKFSSPFLRRKIIRGKFGTLPRRKGLPVASSPRTKRDSSSDEDSDDAVPQTPVAGRCKKQRQWTWTLDPLPGQKSDEGHEKHDDSVMSADDDSVSTSSRFSESSAG